MNLTKLSKKRASEDDLASSNADKDLNLD